MGSASPTCPSRSHSEATTGVRQEGKENDEGMNFQPKSSLRHGDGRRGGDLPARIQPEMWRWHSLGMVSGGGEELDQRGRAEPGAHMELGEMFLEM